MMKRDLNYKRKIIRATVVAFGLAVSPLLSCFSQINESDTLKFQLKTGVYGYFQSGNVELLSQRGVLDFAYSPMPKLVIKSQNNNLYQTFYHQLADNDIFSRNYIYFNPQQRVYPYAIAYVNTNYRLKVDTRTFAGAGVTWEAVGKESHVLKWSLNTVYELTRFSASDYNYNEYDGSRDISLWRPTVYLSGWNFVLGKRLRISYEAYWQGAYGNAHNYRARADLGIDFPLYKGLSFTTAYVFMHENVTASAVRQNDHIVNFGFSYLRKKPRQ